MVRGRLLPHAPSHDDLAVERFAKLRLLLCAHQRENRALGQRNVRVAGQLQHAQGMQRLFIAPGVAGDHRDAQHLNLRRLQQRQHCHLV